MKQKVYFEDMTIGDRFTYQTAISSEQVERFLACVGTNYKEHLKNLIPTHGFLVPPHLIPGILANTTMAMKAYPSLALVRMAYTFMRPIHVHDCLSILEEIVSKREISSEIGEINLKRRVTREDTLVLEAEIVHRILRKLSNVGK